MATNHRDEALRRQGAVAAIHVAGGTFIKNPCEREVPTVV